jgi:heat shock protein HslJ
MRRFPTLCLRAVVISVAVTTGNPAVVAVTSDGGDKPDRQANRQEDPATVAPAGYRARGNEPGWRLDIAGGTITLVTNDGQTRTVMKAPEPTVSGGTRTYAASDRGRAVTVTIADSICVDTMSGMPYPDTVAVALDGKTLNGCGGDPATLLHGEWLVESLAGRSSVKGSTLTITFATDGRIYGSASCNRFMGEFTVTGEGLSIKQPAASMMACVPDEVMTQEGEFLKLLASVARFSIAGGALTLRASDGRTITPRRGN